MNIFLRPFINELIELRKDGFESTTFLQAEPIIIIVHTLLCIADSVARPVIQNVKQFNGKYGCTSCLQKGEKVSVGRGTARVYCYCTSTRRTINDYNDHVKTAVTTNKIVKGIKGPSVTSLLKNFDVTHSFPPDYLHSCLEGVGKMCATEGFDSTNIDKRWYLGAKIYDFNSRLLSIKPPCASSNW